MPRPKGSKNKRKLGIPEELRARLNNQDPMEVLASIYSMDHKALAKMVRSAAGARAMAMKMAAAKEAMPYMHSKMPVKVEVDPDQLPRLVIVTDRHQMQNVQQNQQLIQRLEHGVGRVDVGRDSQVLDVKGETDDGTAD